MNNISNQTSFCEHSTIPFNNVTTNSNINFTAPSSSSSLFVTVNMNDSLGNSNMSDYWMVGLCISVIASITTNTGIALQKLSMMSEEKRPQEQQRPYICQPRWAVGKYSKRRCEQM